jgi:hypothetical protein
VTPRLSTQSIPLIHGAGHGFAQDVLVLVDRARASYLSCLRELKRWRRFVPPGFVPLAMASSLFIAAGAAHELGRLRSNAPPRPRTHLRNARFVLATGRPIAPP